jgi:hypothetical protein
MAEDLINRKGKRNIKGKRKRKGRKREEHYEHPALHTS